MAEQISCVETVLSGGNVFLVDAKDGTLADVMSATDYVQRYEGLQKGLGSVATVMFSSPNNASSFSAGELYAYDSFLRDPLGGLAPGELKDCEPVTAYEDMRGITGSNPYL
jgi:hypothetical protein